MTQLVVQAIASVWPRVGELERLLTPSKSSEFVIETFAHDWVRVLVGGKRHVLLRSAFEATLKYLHLNNHDAENPCLIRSSNDPEHAGPLCRASRATLSGEYGPRNITYVLPILQTLGLVDIKPVKPSSVWLAIALDNVRHALHNPLVQVEQGLLTLNQLGFARYLSALWSGESGSFSHRYKVSKHYCWSDWKARSGGLEWWCQSLSQANEHYSWPEKTAPHDFASIASELRKCIAEDDDVGALVACKAIFAWGGVARKPADASLVWIEGQAVAQTLCCSLSKAVELLHPNSNGSLKEFDGKTLLMNSAMTKIYAAAAPDTTIIYDGRVGAALGLLTRRWLQEKGEMTLPEDLGFRWGPNTKTKGQKDETRNPSKDGCVFTSLYTASEELQTRTRNWADLVRMSSRVLLSAQELLSLEGKAVTLGMLERALFMLGYDVR